MNTGNKMLSPNRTDTGETEKVYNSILESRSNPAAITNVLFHPYSGFSAFFPLAFSTFHIKCAEGPEYD